MVNIHNVASDVETFESHLKAAIQKIDNDVQKSAIDHQNLYQNLA